MRELLTGRWPTRDWHASCSMWTSDSVKRGSEQRRQQNQEVCVLSVISWIHMKEMITRESCEWIQVSEIQLSTKKKSRSHRHGRKRISFKFWMYFSFFSPCSLIITVRAVLMRTLPLSCFVSAGRRQRFTRRCYLQLLEEDNTQPRGAAERKSQFCQQETFAEGHCALWWQEALLLLFSCESKKWSAVIPEGEREIFQSDQVILQVVSPGSPQSTSVVSFC